MSKMLITKSVIIKSLTNDRFKAKQYFRLCKFKNNPESEALHVVKYVLLKEHGDIEHYLSDERFSIVKKHNGSILVREVMAIKTKSLYTALELLNN